jgi:hypothetical protein
MESPPLGAQASASHIQNESILGNPTPPPSLQSIYMLIMSSFGGIVLTLLIFMRTVSVVDLFRCVEGQCECLKDGYMTCLDAEFEYQLDFSEMILAEYKVLRVSNLMNCDSIVKIRARTDFVVLSERVCETGPPKILSTAADHDQVHAHDSHTWVYIVEALEVFFLFLSLFFSAKTRHLIAPLITTLPKKYQNNQTFIQNMFKVRFFDILMYNYLLCLKHVD